VCRLLDDQHSFAGLLDRNRYLSWQNRRQKVFTRGFYSCAGGLDILKFDKNSTDLCFSYFNLGAKPTKIPRGDGTVSWFAQLSKKLSMTEKCNSSYNETLPGFQKTFAFKQTIV